MGTIYSQAKGEDERITLLTFLSSKVKLKLRYFLRKNENFDYKFILFL